jgi:thymidylate synthase (FAD)
MNVMLIGHTDDPAGLCGLAAAICTDSKNWESALHHAVESGHTSVLEHSVFTFQIEGISRACLAQLTRHRLASFDVQSQRYVKLDNPELVMPQTVMNSPLCGEVETAMRYMMELYGRLLDSGVPAEDARYITPQAVPTKLVMTMNARELLHFFSLRTCNRAQWEIRQMADEMLKICRRVSPEIFGKAGPGCVTGKCPEKRPCGSPRSCVEWD